MLVLSGEQVRLRSVQQTDAVRLREILKTPEVSEWWYPQPPEWPLEESPNDTLLTVRVDDTIVGFVHIEEIPNEYFRKASMDLFLHPNYIGKGLGADTIRTVTNYLTNDRGHHRITIDPATDNHRAIRCYENVGFRKVGVMEAYWRDHNTGELRDGLLMELVAR
jgi:aminoglycoside 6'-N-acetyltransferase